MKLAIGSGVAFREFGADLYAHPEKAASRLRWWKRQGVEGIVFYDSLPEFYRTPIDRFRALKAVLDGEGLATPAFNTLRKALHRPELAPADEALLYRCLEVCEVLRPEVVGVNVCEPFSQGLDPLSAAARPLYRGDYASAEVFVQAASRLKPYARACAKLGAKLAIELHDDGIHDTADNCLKLAALIDEPNVGFNPDLGNWYRVPHQIQSTWQEQLRKLAPRASYWDVKNYRRLIVPPDGRVCSWLTELDDGDIDYRDAAVLLWKSGFRGWVCNEGGRGWLSGEGGGGDYVRSNLNYLSYMRWILDEWIASLGET